MSIGGKYLVILALAATLAGCSKSAWDDPNKVDEHPLSKFGQKADVENAKETGSGTAAKAGTGGFMGLGGEGGGLLSGPKGKTKEEARADKLYAGALDVVLELPVRIADRPGGFVATDWKSDPNNPSLRYQLNIRISGQDPYGEVKVVVLRQERMKENWLDLPSDATMAAQIEKAIRKRASVVQP